MTASAVEAGGAARRAGLTRDLWPRLLVALAVVAVVPAALGRMEVLTPFRSSVLSAAVAFGVAALALNVVMGYAGQISLGHWALAGTGAFVSAKVTDPFGPGLSFTAGIVAAMVVTGAVALLIGLPALRLRGLYLAVVTVGFAFVMEHSVFQSSLLSSGSGGVTLPRPWIGDWEFSRESDYLALSLVLLVLVWAVDTNLTRTRPGRAFQALRADEDVAASFGVDVARHKLMAFTISGAFAGLAGAMYGHLVQSANFLTFRYDRSLLLVIMVVVGGLGSRVGVLTFAAFYGAFPLILDEIWGNSAIGWDLIVGAALLLYTLAEHPGGLAEALREAREKKAAKGGPLSAFGPAHRPDAGGPLESGTSAATGLVGDGTDKAPAGSNGHGPATPAIPKLPDLPRPSGLPPRPDLPADQPLLAARDVSIRFGGLQAVDRASIEVRPHRIVGLIGPNGAGKTTLFNIVSGVLRPDQGRIELMGRDVTHLPAHARAGLGMGRTFQHIGLAPDLSVTENLLMAQHQVATYPLWSALLGVGPAATMEDELRARAAAAVEALSFDHYADTPVKSLSHGQQRIVEIGCALVTAPELVLLDEPSAGMAPGAVENLGARLRDIRDELDRTVLLIEHNIPLVLDVCDEIYVLSSGRVIAHGAPEEVVQRDEVVTSYLGEALL